MMEKRLFDFQGSQANDSDPIVSNSPDVCQTYGERKKPPARKLSVAQTLL